MVVGWQFGFNLWPGQVAAGGVRLPRLRRAFARWQARQHSPPFGWYDLICSSRMSTAARIHLTDFAFFANLHGLSGVYGAVPP